jgi:hypothetical protein
MLIDIIKHKNHCLILGNNKIANDDVFEYMISLIDDNVYETFNLFGKEHITSSFIENILNQMKSNKKERIIASCEVYNIDEFLNIFKKEFYEMFENQGFYVIYIYETSQNEDIYIRIYQLENKILKQLDLKGNC